VGFAKKSCGVPALILIGAWAAAFAQTDEIQVYDAEIAPKGVFNLMVHTNSIPIGRNFAEFPAGIIPNHSVNSTSEWAYGVTDWFEQGLYLPVYSLYSHDRGATLNAFKIRELFVRPYAAQHRLFYGVNFEFSVNASYWEPKRITSEIRPIIGTHLASIRRRPARPVSQGWSNCAPSSRPMARFGNSR
jgi:hypothetical protein